MMYLERFLDWCEAHPALTAMVVLPALSAFGNWLISPKSLEAYNRLAANHPRVTAMMQIARGLGADPYKITAWLKTLISGRLPPAPPPEGPGGTGLLARAGEGHGAPPPPPPAPPTATAPVTPALAKETLYRPSSYSGPDPTLRDRFPRTFGAVAAFAIFSGCFLGSLPGCVLVKSPKDAVDLGLSAAQILCVLSSGFLDDAPELRQACEIEERLAPSIRKLFAAQRTGLARAGVSRSPDAGACP